MPLGSLRLIAFRQRSLAATSGKMRRRADEGRLEAPLVPVTGMMYVLAACAGER